MSVFLETRDPISTGIAGMNNAWYGFGTYEDAVGAAYGRDALIDMLTHRASMMTQCGLNPSDPTHWSITDEALCAYLTRAKSLRYFGHPDASDGQIAFREMIQPIYDARDAILNRMNHTNE